MKSLITTFIICSLTFSNSEASVATDVAQLGNLAFGSNVTKIAGRNSTEILRNYIINETGDPEIVLTTKEVEAMAFGDEVDQGFTSFRSAKLMGAFAEGQLSDQLDGGGETPAQVAQIKSHLYNLKTYWEPLVERLARQGVSFAYNGNGPGYCGVSFIKLIIIDPATGRVYDVYLSQSGSC